MVAPTKELHGYGTRAWLRKVAKHEAGHALMLWLLDQYLAGVYICEDGGVTMQVAFPARKMTHPSQHLLYTIAGMVMTYDHDVIDDLRAHVDTPDYFAKETDSYAALRMAEDYQASTCANRIVKTGRHTYTYTYNNVSADPISDLSGAAFLARIIRAGAQGIPLLEVITGMKIAGEKPSLEDVEAHGMGPELGIHAMTKKDRLLYESVLAKLDEQIQEAEENGDNGKIINTLKNQKKTVKGILDSPRSFKDGFNKLGHLVSNRSVAEH